MKCNKKNSPLIWSFRDPPSYHWYTINTKTTVRIWAIRVSEWKLLLWRHQIFGSVEYTQCELKPCLIRTNQWVHVLSTGLFFPDPSFSSFLGLLLINGHNTKNYVLLHPSLSLRGGHLPRNKSSWDKSFPSLQRGRKTWNMLAQNVCYCQPQGFFFMVSILLFLSVIFHLKQIN